MTAKPNPWAAIEEKGVKIGGKHYTVEPINNDDSTTDLGSHNGLTQVIRIREMHPEQKRDTIIHEILHSIMWNNGQNTAAKDELLIECLSHGIDAVLNDNPHLLELWRQQ